MMTETLQIRFTASLIHEPRAWFLPGASTEDWLSEICAWNVPHSAIRLLIVPRSKPNREPIGVLALVSGDRQISTAGRSHPYGRLAGQLYLPVEARLEPAIEETELKSHLLEHRQYVWHPTAGLIGFDPDDILTVSDLLSPTPPTSGQWGEADPGIAFARRLAAIEAVQPLSVEMILQSGQDDIGTESQSLDELPPAPEEKKPRGPLGKALKAPLRPVAGFLHWLGSQVAQPAGGGKWIDRLQKWANQVLSPEHQSARQRELSRLLNMLKDDPDKGLKYAIPMGGDAGRGIAPPRTVLSTHNVDFRFHTSGGPMDYWDIPPDTLRQLTTRYRELAEREIRIGRHRRAAYIYAELLGEMEAAAAALKSGGYYREAAAVYEERLKRPHAAAACFEEGGLWDEALERYERLDEFEKCGQIYRRLEQPTEAEAAYRKAAALCCHRGDYLRGAKLYDEECHDPNEALSSLRLGWPGTSQSQDCLRAEFHLLGREGLHTEAAKRIQELIGPSLNSVHIPALSEVLSDAAGDYPNEPVRATAADATQIIVARKLVTSRKSGIHFEDRRLLRTIEKLAPKDRLLHRDCERYLRGSESPRRQDKPPLSKPGKQPGLVGSVQLPPDMVWHRFEASNRYYFAVGYCDGQMVLARGAWNSLRAAPELVRWRSPVLRESEILLAPSPNDTYDCWVQLLGSPPLPPRLFQGSVHQRAVTPPWTTRDTVALAQTANGVSWTISGTDTLVLSVYSPNDVPIITRQLSIAGGENVSATIPIHARSEGVYLGLNNRLVFIDANNRDGEIPLTGRIVGLSGSAPHSRVRVAVSFEEGGVVFWKDTRRMQSFGHGLHWPWTTFLVTGKLIAVDASKIEVYGTGGNALSFESSMDSPRTPLSIMPVGRNSFAILWSDGRLDMYCVQD